MNIRPNVGACVHCRHDHFNRECPTCHDADGPCRALLQWEAKVLRATIEDKVNTTLARLPAEDLRLRLDALTQKVETLSANVEPPEPQPDLDATIKSLRDTIEGLRNQLYDAKQTERGLDAEVVELQKENHRLTRLAWQAVQDKRVTAEELERAKQHNDELSRDAGALIGVRALNEALTQKQHKLEAENARYFEVIEGVAGQLEKLGVHSWSKP